MPKKHVLPKDIGLTNESKVRVYKNCPSFKSLNPDDKDLAIYGSPQQGYTICSYRDFKENGICDRGTGTSVSYADILKDFHEKNEVKLKKLKENYFECLNLENESYTKDIEYRVFLGNIDQEIREYDDKIRKYDEKIREYNNKIQRLEKDLKYLKKLKEDCERSKSGIEMECVAKMCKYSGKIGVKKENLLKSFRKYVMPCDDFDDLRDIVPNLNEGKIYYYKTKVK